MGMLDSILSALGLRRKAPESSDDVEADDGVGEAPELDPRDDPERDLELEAQDDAGSFDFKRDIARYFTAEFRVETAWDDHERRAVLFGEYEVRDTKHWHQIKATFVRWLETPEAKAIYRTPGDLMQARMTTTQTMTLEDLNLNLEPDSGVGPCLDSIRGVSLERWAKAEAALSGGADQDAIVSELGVDEATWAKVAAEWNERMSGDPSAKIATEYSKHVGSAGVGKLTASAQGVGPGSGDDEQA